MRAGWRFAAIALICLLGPGLLARARGGEQTNSRAALPPRVAARELDRSFEAANKLYEQGKYTRAAEEYERLLQTGKASAALYFNMGNARFKAGQIGRAIASYRRAERLSPRDPDIIANLQFARKQTGGATLKPGLAERILGKLSLNEWTWLAFGAGWIAMGLLAAGQWRPDARRVLRAPVLIACGATVCFGVCLGLALAEAGGEPVAVVIVRSAEVRHGPLEESQTAFTVRDGAELRVIDRKDAWLRVMAGPKQAGWIPMDRVEVLGSKARG